MPTPTEQKPPPGLAQVLSELQHLDISLAERLKAYGEHSASRYPDLATAYDALVARLECLDRSEIGPKLGTQMPEFLLPDEDGNLVSLSSLLRQGPVVISINRGHWCPYCRLELLAYGARHQEIRDAGAQMVSIMPDSSAFTRDYRSRNALPFRILSDVDLGYSELLGLVFWISDDVEQLYRQLAIDLARYHGNQGCFLPFAAKFVVDPKGAVRMREVNVEFRQLLESVAVIASLKNLYLSACRRGRRRGGLCRPRRGAQHLHEHCGNRRALPPGHGVQKHRPLHIDAADTRAKQRCGRRDRARQNTDADLEFEQRNKVVIG